MLTGIMKISTRSGAKIRLCGLTLKLLLANDKDINLLASNIDRRVRLLSLYLDQVLNIVTGKDPDRSVLYRPRPR